MARLSRQHAALVKAYAAAFGLKPRTAQHHRKIQDPKWVQYAQVHGLGIAQIQSAESASQLKAACGPVPDDYVPEDFSAYPLLEAMERRHEVLWRKAAEEAERAVVSQSPVAAIQVRAAADAQRSYREAKKARESEDERSRKVIGHGEFLEFAESLHRVAAVGRGIIRELGETVNPDHPEVGIAVLTEWVETRWNPAIEDIISLALGKGPLTVEASAA